MTAAAVIDDPEADVIRASAAIALVSNRLLEAQADLADLRRSVAETAFLAEVDPSRKKALLDLRARLAAAESRVGELTGPASMRKPASRTPSTSATFMAVTPLSGMIVASPRPSTMVFARLTLIVRSTW